MTNEEIIKDAAEVRAEDPNPSNFCHLHCHTERSLLDGVNRIDRIPDYVKAMGQKALSITDHGTVSGALKFTKACRAANIKPIVGLEAYYSITDRGLKQRDEDEQRYYHMVLLAQNQVGLKNLFQISSRAYTENMYYKPRIDDAMIADHAEGLIATTACIGSRTSFLILNNRKEEARSIIQHHAEMFKDRFFVEIQLHEDEKQQAINAALLDLAAEMGLPPLLTSDSHYTHPSHKLIHEQALCMQTNSQMIDPNRFSFGDIDVSLGSHKFMTDMAKAQNIPYEAISNSMHIADMVNADEYFMDTRNRYPVVEEIPEGFADVNEYLEYEAKIGLFNYFDGKVPPKEYCDRLDEELKVIKRMGFSDYMIITKEICDRGRALDVWIGPGRGSAPGSLVSFALGITQVDPVKYKLIFSRWLNEGRAATPMMFDAEMQSDIDSLRLF